MTKEQFLKRCETIYDKGYFKNRNISSMLRHSADTFMRLRSVYANNPAMFEEIKKTPEPAVFLVSGRFETIQYSAHRFQLTLTNNLTLPGTIDTEKINIESMRQYWGKQVTVKGLVYFSPVGRARLIEAELIKQMDSGEEIFEKLPEPSYHRDLFETPSLGQSAKTPLQEIWGTWPGDETFEDLLIALAKD